MTTSNTPSYEKIDTLAIGAYGIVYSAKMNSDERAIKRNIVSDKIDLLASIRELEMLMMFRGHPFVVMITDCPFQNPLISSLSPTNRRDFDEDTRDDSAFFVFEKAECDLGELCANKPLPVSLSKVFLLQVMLALENIHSKGIHHYDVKPNNILCFDIEDENKVRCKIADFGLCEIVTSNSPPMKHVVATTWWRPPESLTHNYHDLRVDTWSTACVIYQMLVGEPFGYGTERELLTLIEKRFPHPDYTSIDEIKALLHYSDPDIEAFNITYGEYDKFVDLLSHMFVRNPLFRYTISECLNHDYFQAKGLQRIIKETRDFVYDSSNFDHLTITNCYENECAFNLASQFHKYLIAMNHHHTWYRPAMLFSALDIFIRYIEVDYSKASYKSQGSRHGYLLDDNKIRDTFSVCFYIAIKIILDKNSPSLRTVFEDVDDKYIVRQAALEKYIIMRLGYRTFRRTLYDYIPNHIVFNGKRDVTFDVLEAFQSEAKSTHEETARHFIEAYGKKQ